MRRAIVILLAAASLAAVPAHAREAGLWATINVCDPPARPGAVGVRISIPAHGPRAHRQQQWARIRIQYFDGKLWQYLGATGDSGWRHLGRGTSVVRGGTTFTFQPPAAGQRLILRGVVNVQWRLGKRLKGRATLPTESGHVNPKDPQLKTSLASCQISR